MFFKSKSRCISNSTGLKKDKLVFCRMLITGMLCGLAITANFVSVSAWATDNKDMAESSKTDTIKDMTVTQAEIPHINTVKEATPVSLKVAKKETIKTVQVPAVKMQDLGQFTLTGYCPCEICCEQFSAPAKGKRTSIGVGAYEGVTVAVDPKKIPYGTKLYIEGYGVRIASDCGGGINGNHLDIYFATHDKATSVGRRTAEVYKIVEASE